MQRLFSHQHAHQTNPCFRTSPRLAPRHPFWRRRGPFVSKSALWPSYALGCARIFFIGHEPFTCSDGALCSAGASWQEARRMLPANSNPESKRLKEDEKEARNRLDKDFISPHIKPKPLLQDCRTAGSGHMGVAAAALRPMTSWPFLKNLWSSYTTTGLVSLARSSITSRPRRLGHLFQGGSLDRHAAHICQSLCVFIHMHISLFI